MADQIDTAVDDTTFGKYAQFYDALYVDKDYAAEIAFLHGVFEDDAATPVASVLDLGCGTGTHAMGLAALGYEVAGVDRSAAMVEQARAKAAESENAPTFLVGDIRDVDLDRTFDAVVSMFAVVSYQITNEDLMATFATARRHLASDGLFVFDAWFGPAVLVQQPESKTKVIATPEGDTVTRIAQPTLDVIAQTVRVDYTVTHEHKGVIHDEARESHLVRFLFAQELAHLLDASGFTLEAIGPFMDLGRLPTTDDWNVSVLARAV